MRSGGSNVREKKAVRPPMVTRDTGALNEDLESEFVRIGKPWLCPLLRRRQREVSDPQHDVRIRRRRGEPRFEGGQRARAELPVQRGARNSGRCLKCAHRVGECPPVDAVELLLGERQVAVHVEHRQQARSAPFERQVRQREANAET